MKRTSDIQNKHELKDVIINISSADRLRRLSCVGFVRYQFDLADAVHCSLYRPIVLWLFREEIVMNMEERTITHCSSIHKHIPTPHPSSLWGIHLNDNTLCCAITQLPFLFFFIKHSGLAQGQHSPVKQSDANMGKVKNIKCYRCLPVFYWIVLGFTFF